MEAARVPFSPPRLIGIVDAAEMGGAQVFRPFTVGAQTFRKGDRLPRETLLAIPASNLRALVNNRYIAPFPRDPDPAENRGPARKFVVSLGKGEFGVVEGWRITAEPMTREAAQALAAG
ncbi:MAG TPA: hypothetical protein VFA12_20280 [Stellaceae bacterium]|nr:hypothetical protein [Stellaceae bacterium]